MPTPTALIATAWRFYRKHPVLNEVGFWFFFVPIAAVDALSGVVETAIAQNTELQVPETSLGFAIMLPLIVFVVYFALWGQACTLTVAKRMIASPAGRNRTSFKAVRKEARKYIGALFTTEILRAGMTLLWCLLLIVPGIIYSIRTMFFDIMMIEDGKVSYGRQILQRSTTFVRGHTWDVFWRLTVVGLMVFIPVLIIDGTILSIMNTIDPRLATFANILTDLVDSAGGVFFVLCTVTLYADMKHS